MLRRNKGIINLDARGSFAEVTVSLLSGVVVITKLCVSGTLCVCVCVCVLVCPIARFVFVCLLAGIRAEVKDTMLSTEFSARY